MSDTVLWILLFGTFFALLMMRNRSTEHFISQNDSDLLKYSTAAINSAPTSSEVKTHYRNVLLYAADDIKSTSTTGCGMRILEDFRNRVYGKVPFKNLVISDFTDNWPSWMAPLSTTITEPIPDPATAAASEAKLLAFVETNYPMEPTAESVATSLVTLLLRDFGDRFLFVRSKQSKGLGLRPDFLREPLTNQWANPCSTMG